VIDTHYWTTISSASIVNLGESFELSVKVPFHVYNNAGDSMVYISHFKKLLMGFLVTELVADTLNPYGVKGVNAKHKFDYSSNNVRIDLTEGVGGKSRVRFYLKKDSGVFWARIIVKPREPGVYSFLPLDGVIEDAFCRTTLVARWGDYKPSDGIRDFQNFGNVTMPPEHINAYLSSGGVDRYIMVKQ
jgi:hypothetical protein